MKKWWWIFALIFLPVHADIDAYKLEVKKIDAQIQKLNVEKQKHVNLARKYQAEGDRWQYSTGRIEDAHKNWDKADDERAQAIALQLRIDALYEKKHQIYQFYPQLQNE